MGTTDTQTINKIVITSVEQALKAREGQCKLHASKLDTFEKNQDEFGKDMKEATKTLAAIQSRLDVIIKNNDELFVMSHKNRDNITRHDERIKVTENDIKDIKGDNKSLDTAVDGLTKETTIITTEKKVTIAIAIFLLTNAFTVIGLVFQYISLKGTDDKVQYILSVSKSVEDDLDKKGIPHYHDSNGKLIINSQTGVVK